MVKWLGFGLLLLLSCSIYAQDIVITSYDGRTTFSQYEEFSEKITIKNDGIVPISRSIECEIYLSEDATVGAGDPYLAYGYVLAIGAGQSLSLQFNHGEFDVPPGTYNLIIKADQNNYVQETNEQNNQYVVENIVVGQPDVDWKFVSLSIDSPDYYLMNDTVFHVSEELHPSFTMVNTGTTNTNGALFSSYYLSKDQVLDGSDVSFGGMRSRLDGVDQITRAHDWSDPDFVIPASLKPGKYYVIGKADSGDDFRETDETNNTFVSQSIAIGKGDADLSIDNISSASYDDGMLNLSYTIRNNGTTGAGGYRVNVFLSTDTFLDYADYAFPDDGYDPYDGPYVKDGYSEYGMLFRLGHHYPSIPNGSYYVIISIDGVVDTNISNNVFISPIQLIDIAPPPVPAISMVSASFNGAYDNTDKKLKLDVSFTNTASASSDYFMFDIIAKDNSGETVYQTTHEAYLNLTAGQSKAYSWEINMTNPLLHGLYQVTIKSSSPGYVGLPFTTDLNIDIPTFAVRGTIQGEDGVPINQGKMFLYQKHDNGTVSFINHTEFTASNAYSFLTDYHQHTLFYIPDPKAYSNYVPTIFGKAVTLKDECFFSLTQDMDTVFEVLKVTPLASGKKTISGNVYTDASPNGRKGSAAARITERTGSDVEGFPIVLLSSAGIPVGVTTTDSNGHYEFMGLPDDTYQIVVALELDKPVMQEPLAVDVRQRDAVVEFGLGEQQVQPVLKRFQEITFQSLPQKTFGDSPFVASVSASSELAVTLSSSNPKVAKILNGKIEIVGAGSTTITASQPGEGEYLAASTVTRELVVKKAQQTLTVAEIPEKTYGNAPFSLQVQASANATITITSSDRNIANISQNRIYVVKPGTVDITVKAEGGTNYEAATVVRKLVINKQDQRITFEELAEMTMGDAAHVSLTAKTTSSLPVSFASDNEAVATIDANNVLTIRGAGVANITAKQEGNDYFNAAVVSRILRVNIIAGIEKPAKSFKAFPNPVADQLTIEGVHPINNITLTDASGHILDNVSWTENTVDLHWLSPGVYLVKVESVNGPEVLRIVKR